jgi:hypothetical protein
MSDFGMWLLMTATQAWFPGIENKQPFELEIKSLTLNKE